MGKICSRCKTKKALTEFSKCKSVKDGYARWCRQCANDRYRENRELVLTRMKETRKSKPDHYRKMHIESSRRYPEKKKAGNAVMYAIKTGKLEPAREVKCAISRCESQADEYHHWSYLPEHWLSVIPVCTSCHGKIHGRILILDDPVSLTA